MFETSSPGLGEEAEGEAAEDRYPPPPQRSYRLSQLLRLAGLEEQADSAPDVEISALLTCNSITPAAEGGALYVCVPSTDGAHDGHDWADEVGWAGRSQDEPWGRVCCCSLAALPGGGGVKSISHAAAWHIFCTGPFCCPAQAMEAGAVAVLAERPLPDALLPVVVVPDTLRALSALSDAFYERPSRHMRTVGLVGRCAPEGGGWVQRRA